MLSLEFYKRSDVVAIARDLIGTWLFTKGENEPLTGGMIIETEAYAGIEDRASHAFGDRRTKRTEVMYSQGGIAYVYLCYGMYPLLNVVTNKEGIPHAVLIRAIQPIEGLEVMQKRRKGKSPLANGPGMLTQALSIKMLHNSQSLFSPSLWIEERKTVIKDAEIEASKRIGIDYAKEHALLPWRFRHVKL
jgi:DNA-3-methyladenine glycosylase